MEQRCRSGQACVALTEDGPAITYKQLCQRCVDQVQDFLDRLPEVARVLPAWKGGIRGENGEAKVSTGKSEAPCPLRVAVVDLIDDINNALHHVGTRAADIANQDNGPEWFGEIRRIWKAADKTIGLSPHFSRRLTPCPECGQRSLGNYAGAEIITCTSCHHVMDRDAYNKDTLLAVSREKGKPRK